jgi:hypothetical protein
VDTLAGQRARGELAALVVRGNAARSAWGYESQASNFRAKAKYALEQGDDAALGALLGAGGEALGMAGKAGAFQEQRAVHAGRRHANHSRRRADESTAGIR